MVKVICQFKVTGHRRKTFLAMHAHYEARQRQSIEKQIGIGNCKLATKWLVQRQCSGPC